MITRSQKPSLLTLLFAVRGTIMPFIWRKVLFTVLVSTLVVFTHHYYLNDTINLATTPFTLWGLTLAIFLGFRNTAAYDRFWEARTLWGDLLITARNLTRQLVTLMPGLPREQQRALGQRLITFTHSLTHELRGQPHDLPRCDVQTAQLSLAWREAARQQQVSDILYAEMERQLAHLAAIQSGCERIKTTPIPYSYILMLHRVVHVYCFLLPFCLAASLGWFTPFAVCVLAYTFFGLDALGDQIADPFGTEANDLPLNAMTRQIEIAVLSILGEPAPEPLRPVKDVLL